jgi:uncharacterized protein YkwD
MALRDSVATSGQQRRTEMTSRRSSLHRARPGLEQLEQRQVLSGYSPSAAEQLFLEELNNARANPAAYGASIALDLSGVAPSPPLAFNTNLIEAARLHSIDMDVNNYFAHDTPQGVDPGARMTAAGFVWNSWGESIAGGTAYPGPADALAGLIIDRGVPDLGHRIQLLAMAPAFLSQNQVGIGIVQAGTGSLTNYYTVDTANSPTAATFLTGCVFNDTNGNGRYDIGEGVAGVTITATLAGTATTFSTTTWSSGGYTLALEPGTYTVTTVGSGLPSSIIRTVTIGSQNVRLDSSPQDDSYIEHLYATILGRGASNAEVALWDNVLQGWGGPQAVASGIQHSPEALTRIVDGWYVSYLGRSPHNGEEQGWVALLERGETEEAVLSGILGSKEFYDRQASLNPAETANQAFIQSLYSLLLARTPSGSEVSYWQGMPPTAGRAQVALAFLQSQEFRQDVVIDYYRNLLHRSSAPSPSEVAGWTGSAFSILDICVLFESSSEFFSNSQ